MRKRAIVFAHQGLIGAVSVSLSDAGLSLTIVEDAAEGMAILSAGIYDLIVTQHPGPGIEKLRVLSDAPILAVVDVSDFFEAEPILLLADDGVLANFEAPELTIRAKVLLQKRRQEAVPQDKQITASGLCLSQKRHSVTYLKKDIHATKTEYKILELLSSHPEQVFAREQIYDAVWGDFAERGTLHSINNHIYRLNKKLRAASGHGYICANRGVGYYFSPPSQGKKET